MRVHSARCARAYSAYMAQFYMHLYTHTTNRIVSRLSGMHLYTHTTNRIVSRLSGMHLYTHTTNRIVSRLSGRVIDATNS